ncbi:MAG: hypothetical protein R8K47_06670 [Mariprofundaceae bacterium]
MKQRWKAVLLALLMATGAAAAQADEAREASGMQEAAYEESWLTANKMHMYLGIGSLAAAAAAAVTAPEAPEGVVVPVNQRKDAKKTFHHQAAVAAAALGGAAILSGLITHWDDVTNSDGLMDPDIMHMILGIVGTAGYVWAISKGPKLVGNNSNGHATAGLLGGAAMITAISYEW